MVLQCYQKQNTHMCWLFIIPHHVFRLKWHLLFVLFPECYSFLNEGTCDTDAAKICKKCRLVLSCVVRWCSSFLLLHWSDHNCEPSLSKCFVQAKHKSTTNSITPAQELWLWFKASKKKIIPFFHEKRPLRPRCFSWVESNKWEKKLEMATTE